LTNLQNQKLTFHILYAHFYNPGTPSIGALVQYASGTPQTLSSLATTGLPGFPAFVGLGSSAMGLSNLGPTIDLSGNAVANINFAHIMPIANSTLDAFSAFVSTSDIVIIPVDTIATITAQVYTAVSPTLNTFTPVAFIDFGPLTGSIPAGKKIYLLQLSFDI